MKNQTQVQQFHSEEFGSLEVIMIGDKPYFPATECAKILGYNQPEHAIKRHCLADGCTKRTVIDRLGREQDMKYISEGNLYRLIIRSKLPAAVRFENWVCDEVLPSIRKHGAYATPSTLEDMYSNPLFTEGLIEALMEEHTKNVKLEKKIDRLAPKARYCDQVLRCSDAVQASIIAKDYGISTVNFNKALHELGIQYKIGKTWLLYQKHAGKGYTNSKTYYTPDGNCVIHTYWTQKGRLFLYERLAAIGILPECEYQSGIEL